MKVSFSWPLPYNYYPPMLGNGTLAMPVDPRGSIEQRDYCKAIAQPSIVRAGYRYDNHAKEVVPFGVYETYAAEWGEPQSMEQELAPREGRVSGVCRYQSGLETYYTAFIPQDADFLAIKTGCRGGRGTEKAFFRYTLAPARLQAVSPEPGKITWTLDGITPDGVNTGDIWIYSEDPEAKFTVDGQTFSVESSKREAVFYLVFGAAALAKARARDFNGHLQATADFWKNYFAQAYIRTPDEACNRVCDTALYYLKTVTTPWSIPTGLIPSHWRCRYFCFDEFFDLEALLRVGHPELAKHVPDFRLQILPVAQKRYYNYGMSDSPAHYPWESGEDGLEATTDGYWQDHVFEHSNVVVGAWEYWKYTNDPEAAEKYYPVMRACLLYLELQHVVRDSVRGYEVGVVTDFERLGPSRRNPFMTCCGLAYALRCGAETAEFLGKDAEDVVRWRKIADDLIKNLPRNDERYLVYPDAKDTCVGIFAGICPFPVLKIDDPLQLAAAEDFLDREGEFGCMLKTMGKEICTWYSAWKTSFYAHVHQRRRAAEYLAYTVRTAGFFGESFESNHRIGSRPWFATGSAATLQAAAECLFLAEGDTLRIAPGIPEDWKDYEFLLSAPGDLKVHCLAENGKISLEFIPGKNFVEKTYTVIFPDGHSEQQTVKK